MASRKVSYLLRSLRGSLSGERMKCPCCHARSDEVVQRKHWITRLMRCPSCRLLYRVPTDPPARNATFYQSDYECGFTTDCPDEATLKKLVDTGFKDSEKDFSYILKICQSLGVKPGARVLDFGASWGYGTWQFRQAGYNVEGYEISVPRARYAREKLGVPVTDKLETVNGPFDLFYSSHVLEHVPSPANTVAVAGKLVRSGGLFVALTPNGSLQRMASNPIEYKLHWGDLHPNFLDVEFYQRLLGSRPKLICSSPYDYDAIRAWDQANDLVLDLTGGELLAVAVL